MTLSSKPSPTSVSFIPAAPDQGGSEESPNPNEQKEPGQEVTSAGAEEEKTVSGEAAEEKNEAKADEVTGEEKNDAGEEKNEDVETGDGQSEEKTKEEGEGDGGQEDECAAPANKYYTVSYRKIKKGYARQRISAFETQDFVPMEEEEGASEEAEAQTTGEASCQDEKTDGEGRDGEKADGEVGDEQEEEDGEDEYAGEEACNGSDGKQKQSGISKYFTISYRKIKKGVTKQRVDEFEFMGVQP
ncbi:spore wall protein 2 [Tachysurus ichikawai]